MVHKHDKISKSYKSTTDIDLLMLQEGQYIRFYMDLQEAVFS